MLRTVDVAEAIDSGPLGRFQIGIAALCAAVLFMEGFDAQTIAYVAPALIREWQLPAATFGPVFSAGLTGMLLGILCLSTAADYVGRRTVIVACTGVFGACTAATVAVHSLESMTVIRLLTGFFLGGTIPNAVAMTAEFSPRRSRVTIITIMVCGISLGAAAGGPVAAQLVPRLGWQSVFYVGGLLPLALTLVLLARLPESIRFLALRKGRDGQIAGLLRRIQPGVRLPPDAVYIVAEESGSGLTVKHLFSDGRTAMTLLLWLMFAMNMLDMYFLRSWLPTVISGAGMSVQRAVMTTALFDVAGIVGTLSVGWVVDRFNSCGVLGGLYLAGGVFTSLIGFSMVSPDWLIAAVFCAGFCLLAAQNASNAVVVGLYPTFMRSTSIGWAIGIGRIGSILGPLMGAAMLALHWRIERLFLVSGVPAMCAALAAFALLFLIRRAGRSPVSASLQNSAAL